MTQKHELEKLKGQRNYKGCLVSRRGSFWLIWGILCTSPKDVDEVIGRTCLSVKDSIENNKKLN